MSGFKSVFPLLALLSFSENCLSGVFDEDDNSFSPPTQSRDTTPNLYFEGRSLEDRLATTLSLLPQDYVPSPYPSIIQRLIQSIESQSVFNNVISHLRGLPVGERYFAITFALNEIDSERDTPITDDLLPDVIEAFNRSLGTGIIVPGTPPREYNN